MGLADGSGDLGHRGAALRGGALVVLEGLTRRFSVRVKDGDGRGVLSLFGRQRVETLTAVDDLSFTIARGEKVAFIGPNGAGKSTTLRMLCGLLRPSAGKALVSGFVPWQETRKLAQHIGLVFGQRSTLWPALPVRESFDLLGRIYGLDRAARITRIGEMAELFHLHGFLDQAARTLSLGQRMRCDIAAALLHAPALLFLDEPTIGLDVTTKALLRDHLNELTRVMGTTILLTSHDTDDIEKICDRIILIDRGRQLLDTSIQDLRQRYTRTKTLRITTLDEIPPYERIGVMVVEHKPTSLTLNVDVAAVPVEQVVAECLARHKIQDIAIENLPLEEVIKTLYLEQQSALAQGVA